MWAVFASLTRACCTLCVALYFEVCLATTRCLSYPDAFALPRAPLPSYIGAPPSDMEEKCSVEGATSISSAILVS